MQQQAASFLCTPLCRVNLNPTCSHLGPNINILVVNMDDDEIPNVVVLDCLAVFVVVVLGNIGRDQARVLLHPGVVNKNRRGEHRRDQGRGSCRGVWR